MDYTTSQVARMIGVDRNTIVKAFDKGELKGYRKGPRRYILQDKLVDFLKKYKIPYLLVGGKIYTHKKYYSIGQAAKHSRLPVNTIIKLVDSGELKGFRIPCSRFRRISEFSFMAFLKNHGIPFYKRE